MFYDLNSPVNKRTMRTASRASPAGRSTILNCKECQMGNRYSNVRPKNFKDITGHVFGRLTAIEYMHRDNDLEHKEKWKCRRECGNLKFVSLRNLRNGSTRSCGCLLREATVAKNLEHGKSHTAEHNVWWAMIQRCEDPNNKGYSRYGARGIRICDRWRQSFSAFFSDMGPRPTASHSIDRIDNNGNYEPANCRWATSTQQARNTRHNHMVTFRGQKMALTDASELAGLSPKVVSWRIRDKWTEEEALTTPMRPRNNRSNSK